MAASEAELTRRAMRLGGLAAIQSEEYAAAEPEEIARRRLFFGDCWKKAARVVARMRLRCSLLTAELAIVSRFWYTIAK